MKIFSERLKELRREAKISAKNLGEKIGVSDATIVRWENDKVEPTLPYVYKLCVFFNVTADYLIGLED